MTGLPQHRELLTELLVAGRMNAHLPVAQQLIRLANDSKTECCRNSPTSMILGNPLIARSLFTLPNIKGLLSVIRGLTGYSPENIGSLRELSNQLVATVPAAAECFANYHRQQDAHEWLVYLLDGLEQEMPAAIRDPFVSLFKVNTEVTSRCTAAGHLKSKMEVDMVLSIPIQHPHTEENFDSLSQCLISYFSDELVDIDCQSCDCHQAQQSHRMMADPDVLVIHLLRFNREQQKIGHRIEFPTEISGKCDDTPYVLTGVVVHTGKTLQSGHYRTVIRCHKTDRLFLLDDAKEPQLLKDNDVVWQGIFRDAYILLFSKQDKTDQHVGMMVDLSNRLMTGMGTDDPVIAAPVHCDSSRESEAWFGQPIQSAPAEVNVDVLLPGCEESAMQEAIRQSFLNNVDLSGAKSPNTTKRKSRELTPDSPSTPRTSVAHAVGSAKTRFKKAGRQTMTTVSNDQPQSYPPPVQPAAECQVETAPSDDELPDPGFVPMRSTTRDQSANVPDCDHDMNEPGAGYILSSSESEYINLIEEIGFITAVPAKDRTDDQKKRLRNLKVKHKKLENNFQHLNAVMPPKPKTASERKAAERARKDQQSKEAEKAADRARKATEEARAADRARKATEEGRAATRERMATEEARAATRERMATEEARAADRARKATEEARAADRARKATEEGRAADRARKANRKLKSKVGRNDGMRCNEVLAGTMLVPDLSDTDDSIGKMDHVCSFCHALKFRNETPNLCCNNGHLVIDPFPRLPHEFMALYRPETSEDAMKSKVFLKYIRPLNNALCLSSLKANYRTLSNYNPAVIIQGQVHQFAGPLQPRDGETPVFAQLYVQDSSLETTTRFANLTLPAGITEREKHVLKSILLTLQDALKVCNPYVKDFRQIINIPDEQLGSARLIISAKARPQGQQERRYNQQYCLEEVSLLTVNGKHDLVLTKKDGRLEIVSEQNHSAMPLHFTLLFPTGTKGWHPDLKQNPGTTKRLTCREFTVFHLNWRQEGVVNGVNLINTIHFGGRLFQEWIVIQWLVAENMKLNWLSLNQKSVRADTYDNVRRHVASNRATTTGDALYQDDNRPQVGQKILPKSVTGCPRWYQSRYLNGMAIVKKYKKPTYFVTMTCNPHWPEIQENLAPGQTAQDRPDLVARVFKLKKDQLINDLIHGGLLGMHIAHLAVIEFQKKGLPHVHILLIVAGEDEVRTAEDIDNVISAELPPDPNEPGLTKEQKDQRQWLETIVKTNMIHGPCGALNPKAPCMEDGKCTKRYPKPFAAHTVVDSNSTYATYRRRCPEDGGRTIQLVRGGIPFTADNTMVVPYNPFLSLRYNCHINCEKCCSILGAKYVFKYTTKGPDRAMVSAEMEDHQGGRDEIENYKDMRCVGSCEAAWKLFQFPIASQYPSVKDLRVHLDEGQTVVFEEGEEEEGLARSRNTELMAFFELNKTLRLANTPIEEMPMYVDVPEAYTWDQKGKRWKKRVRQCDIGQTIGRVHAVPHTAGDVFYLRMLLNHPHSRGKESFQDMLTLPSGVCESYKKVCEELGLLQDDGEWYEALAEGAEIINSSGLRGLYVSIICWSDPSNPRALFDRFWTDWADDFKQKATNKGLVLDDDQLKTLVLLDLKHRLQDFQKELRDFQLEEPTDEQLAAVVVLTEGQSAVISEELDFNVNELLDEAKETVAKYTDEQRAVHHRILGAVENNTPLILYVNAKGGCGKTFLLNGVLKTVRSLEGGGCVALAMATTGIAAILLEKGRTFHSRMKAPLNPDDESMLKIPAQSELAKLVRMARLLVIDEATMLDNRQLAALDRTLKDLMRSEEPFGGKVLVLSGDMRQCLPVVKGASRAGIVERCINQSPLWQHFEVMELTKNMRVLTSGEQRLIDWDQLTTDIGNGTCSFGPERDQVMLPPEMCFKIEENTQQDKHGETRSMKKLADKVFPDLKKNLPVPNWLNGRAILTPTNFAVDGINDMIVADLPDPEIQLYSADQVEDLRDSRGFSVEYMNGLNPTGMPRHCIAIKPGVPLMLLRNIDPKNGLCNGSRLIFKQMSRNNRLMICSYTINGVTKEVAIPRIMLKPKELDFPFDWSRRQFPVRLAFATTINKSQGQTMKRIGVWLPQPVFGHGQLYVALSRVGDPNQCTIAIKPGKDDENNCTRNVVFKEVLLGCVAAAQLPQVHTTSTVGDEPLVWEDLDADWPDYDGIEDVEDSMFEEEFEMSYQRPIPTRRTTQSRLSLPIPRNAGPLPPIEPDYQMLPLEDHELSEYELLQRRNIEECRAQWLEVFGVDYPNVS